MSQFINNIHKLFFVLAFIFLYSCSTTKLVYHENMDTRPEMLKKKKKTTFLYSDNSKEPLMYAPFEKDSLWNYMRTVRVNVHFMHDSTSNQNIPESQAHQYAKNLIRVASDRVMKNEQMHLPEGNNTPVLPPNYRYKLYPNDKDAVYIHHDNDLCYFIDRGKHKNNYSRKVIKKYSVNQDSILNIFVIPHHPDSVASKTYPAHSSGIALGHALKISKSLDKIKKGGWSFARILNHEIGHILGLSHSWIRNDGCDDTPSHKNCYDNTGPPPCDKQPSNNMMDYNNEEIALTPCQIGKIHMKIAKLNSRQRKLIIPDWCELDTNRTIIIQKNTLWERSMDINQNVRIEAGSTLEINCRISFAPGSSLYIAPGATLILDNARLHNACGKTWEGIISASRSRQEATIIHKNHVLIENIKERTENKD